MSSVTRRCSSLTKPRNDASRQFPLDVIPELQETINRQLEANRLLKLEQGSIEHKLLFHNKGRPIVDYRPAWHRACAAAGLSGRIRMTSGAPRPGTLWPQVWIRSRPASWLDGRISRCCAATTSSTGLRSSVAWRSCENYLDAQNARSSKSSAIGGGHSSRSSSMTRERKNLGSCGDFWCPGRESNPDLRFRRPP